MSFDEGKLEDVVSNLQEHIPPELADDLEWLVDEARALRLALDGIAVAVEEHLTNAQAAH